MSSFSSLSFFLPYSPPYVYNSFMASISSPIYGLKFYFSTFLGTPLLLFGIPILISSVSLFGNSRLGSPLRPDSSSISASVIKLRFVDCGFSSSSRLNIKLLRLGCSGCCKGCSMLSPACSSSCNPSFFGFLIWTFLAAAACCLFFLIYEGWSSWLPILDANGFFFFSLFFLLIMRWYSSSSSEFLSATGSSWCWLS